MQYVDLTLPLEF